MALRRFCGDLALVIALVALLGVEDVENPFLLVLSPYLAPLDRDPDVLDVDGLAECEQDRHDGGIADA